MYITQDDIVSGAALFVAIVTILGALFAAYRWYLKQGKQDKDIASIKEEMTLLCFCMSATLDGLIQLDCNHSVPVAKDKLDKYINKKAHEQEE